MTANTLSITGSLTQEYILSADVENEVPAESLVAILKTYVSKYRFPVFPIDPKNKTPLCDHGFKDASRNKDVILSWIKQFPGCGWGIPTGDVSGFFVVDADAWDSKKNEPKHGIENWNKLCEEHNYVPNTPIQKTKNNGRHYLYKMPSSTDIRNSTDKVAKDIDVRGNGGYIAAYPTSGYIWLVGLDTDISDAPEWLVTKVAEKRSDEQYHPPSASRFEFEPTPEQFVRDVAILKRLPGYRWDDQDTWLKIGMAWKDRWGEDGFEVWDQLCQKADSYDATENRKRWNSFDGSKKDSAITWGTVLTYLVNDKKDKDEWGEVIKEPTPRISIEIPKASGETASKWLDEYIEFSKKWSPRSYIGYHEACGLWLLSTIAARRVVYELGDEKYTNLYIAMISKTSIYAKSTTARIAQKLLSKLDLDFLLAPYSSTPQKFIKNMSLYVPDGWSEMSLEAKKKHEKEMAFHGSRGMYHDEFGGLLQGIAKKDGVMNEWRSILRTIDNADAKISTDTIGRGYVSADDPYLALLGSATPADIRLTVGRNNSLWTDGFFARFAFITPPRGAEVSHEKFIKGTIEFPNSLIEPLRKWHERLGIPQCEIYPANTQNDKGKSYFIPQADARHKERCFMDDDVFDASYDYLNELSDAISDDNAPDDLAGNYARFHEKAMRIAALLASLENGGHIEMRHWIRGQEITERWRNDLHELYDQLQEGREKEEQTTVREKAIKMIDKASDGITMRTLKQNNKGHEEEVETEVEKLVQEGTVTANKEGKTTRYYLGAVKE